MAKEFNFKGTEARKFFIAGSNYIRKVLRLNREKATLFEYAEENYTQVCNEGCMKGFCYGRCKDCPVQKAYETTLKELSHRESTQTVINVYGGKNVFNISEPCAKDRGVKRP